MTDEERLPPTDPEVKAAAGMATGTGIYIAPQQFVDSTWLRWWPVAAIAVVVLLWVFVITRGRIDTLGYLCSGTLGVMAIAFLLFLLSRSVSAVNVDSAGLHARHGLGATTDLPWERITGLFGGGRYGPPLTLLGDGVGLSLHRRLTDWPQLYALVQQARPEFWTNLDPSRLKSPMPTWLVVAIALQVPNAISMATGTRPITGTVLLIMLIPTLLAFFYEPRAISLSADGVEIRLPLRRRFIPRSGIAGFSLAELPFWRRGVKLHRSSGRDEHLGIMECGEGYMLAVLNEWLTGGES